VKNQFLDDLKELNKFHQSKLSQFQSNELRSMFADIGRGREYWSKVFMICSKYGLNVNQFKIIISKLATESNYDYKDDLAHISNIKLLDLQSIKKIIKKKFNYSNEATYIENDYRAFIGLSNNTTKAELIDYIEKNYHSKIKPLISNKKVSFKNLQLERNSELKNFVWKNQDMPHKELAKKVSKKFNKICTPGYISKMLSRLRKQRD
jgi:hypothetical protein